ncbi:twin-arginine translocation signal domain-containing protein [Salinicoccus sp. RF5]|nr:twin-arginine translocation signal domain-containing protein [Salinicoccus sp. RF5]
MDRRDFHKKCGAGTGCP